MFEYYNEHFLEVTGVTLARGEYGENNLWMRLFVKEHGIISVTARQGMGDTEPFEWGTFYLKKKQRGHTYFVNEIDIRDDMLHLRRSREQLITALKWSDTLLKYLVPEQPDDELLTNLYWNMKLLAESKIPPEILDWRFLWRWLELWGLAPEIISFHTSHKFNNDEIILLAHVSQLNTKGVIKLFTSPISTNIRENAFKVASNLAAKFLNEK